ncbi:UPF0462 protein C4orf33 homolog [Glandiceps talaboti]
MATHVYQIKTQWNSTPIDHNPIEIKLSGNHDNGMTVTMEVAAPFFNDPPAPKGEPGKPFPQLWDYEVVEAFFLGENNKYLEVELCPHGQHLVLALNGFRNMFKDELVLDYQATLRGNTWTGVAKLPMEYFPPNTTKFNAYAIHGSGNSRVYESLYPVEADAYTEPDFHRLEYFKEVDFKAMINFTKSDLWTV